MTPAMIALAMALANQGLTYWTEFQARAKAGTLTQDDLDHAGLMLDADLDKLAADITAEAAKQVASQPPLIP